MWRDLLQAYDFARTNELLMNIKTFLASTFNLHATLTVYILPNVPDAGVIGHRISGTDFILLRPYIEYRQSAIANVVTVVLHEYIHAIESCSKRTRINEAVVRGMYCCEPYLSAAWIHLEKYVR
jgi:hypothetical protein